MSIVHDPRICDLIKEREASGAGPFLAFEYFPPRTATGVENLCVPVPTAAASVRIPASYLTAHVFAAGT